MKIIIFIVSFYFLSNYIYIYVSCCSPSCSLLHEPPSHHPAPLPLIACLAPHAPIPISSLEHSLLWGTKPPQDQVHPFLLKPDKAVLCYMPNLDLGIRPSGWLCVHLSQVLAESLRGLPYQATVWKHIFFFSCCSLVFFFC